MTRAVGDDAVNEPRDRQARFRRPDLMVSVNARHSAGLKARTEPSGFLESRASRKVGSAETSTHEPLFALWLLLRQMPISTHCPPLLALCVLLRHLTWDWSMWSPRLLIRGLDQVHGPT